MEALPLGNVRTRLESMLDELKVHWTRSELPVPTNGPQSNPRDSVEVTYLVGDGPLEGNWSAAGPDAELVLLDRMLEQLDADWRYYLAEYGRIAAAMRRVGK